ncbi:unnamed protein product [Cochlearia groenlandica]
MFPASLASSRTAAGSCLRYSSGFHPTIAGFKVDGRLEEFKPDLEATPPNCTNLEDFDASMVVNGDFGERFGQKRLPAFCVNLPCPLLARVTPPSACVTRGCDIFF